LGSPVDGVRFISGFLSYDVSLRQLEKPAKGTQGKPKKQKLICPCKHGKMTSFSAEKK
jgi:hypothetical protein